MTDDDFVRSFEECTLPNSAFHHRDHVRLAWIYLRREPALDALARFTASLRRFAAFQGHPGLYHETITWAFLFLIHERMAGIDEDGDEGAGEGGTWEEFAARHPDLLAWQPSILDAYYDPETLRSEHARRRFVLPRPKGASGTETL
jgi:hypothetical protein